jgi:hypothetical protein
MLVRKSHKLFDSSTVRSFSLVIQDVSFCITRLFSFLCACSSRYTKAQLPLTNTSNSRAHYVQLISAHSEPKFAVICENWNLVEAFCQLLGLVAILRLSCTPHCNKPEPDVYTYIHTHTYIHTYTNVNIIGSHKYPVTSSRLAYRVNKAHLAKCPGARQNSGGK